MSDVQYVENTNPHSVEIKTNAKGEASITVKSYGKTVDRAREAALKTFNELNEEISKKD